jgi:RNA polymerase sigma factor (TIGR02999 family)
MDAGPIDPLIHLLRAARAGEAGAQDRLVRALYDELRQIAGRRMRRERPGHTLQPSALVHEAVLRLLRGEALADPADRGHLLATAARAMRQVLIDHARHRRVRPEGRMARVPLDEALAYLDGQRLDVLALHEALDRLACEHPRPARVVDLRFFGGVSIAEAAEVLEVSDTTVEADWRFARAWLREQLGGQDDDA